ncbi:FERM domain-containing protein 6-like, partial [Penaeus indicus]|uniref:FERM domain-containing protein 6-like n=1 Tax=Penaeus indicus TaxID=29960 RepID=UPI00300C3001
GLDEGGEALLQFRFRVQFYVETHLLLRDRVSRLHYYLQLRDNVVAYTQPISEEATFLLAAYALQADLGDFCEDQHQGHYFDPNLYFPPWVVERVGLTYIMEHAPHMHRDNLGLTQAEAHAQYIREASQQEAPHNLHIYQLRYKKQDPSPQVALAICAKGVEIYEEEMGPITPSRKLISSFQWSNIGKLSFEVSPVLVLLLPRRRFFYRVVWLRDFRDSLRVQFCYFKGWFSTPGQGIKGVLSSFLF